MKPNVNLLRLFKVIPLIFLGGCSALGVINSVSKIYTVETKQNIAFDPHPKLQYDLYYPKSKNTRLKETPVLVFFYGGSWNRGDKSEYEFVGRRLASMGYIIAVPNYRLYPEVKYPEFLEDNIKAVKAIQTELKKGEYMALKPAEKFIMMGHSAGAYNAAMLAFDSTWASQIQTEKGALIKGFIGMAGAYNIYPIKDTEVQPVFHHPDYPAQSQPIHFTDQRQAPSLILTPETDTLVSIERNSQTLHDALTESGNASTIKTIEGTDHVTLIATLSPLLFFKGSSTEPIKEFVDNLHQ